MNRKRLFVMILFVFTCRLTAQEEIQINYFKLYEITASEGKKVAKAGIETNGIEHSEYLNDKM